MVSIGEFLMAFITELRVRKGLTKNIDLADKGKINYVTYELTNTAFII